MGGARDVGRVSRGMTYFGGYMWVHIVCVGFGIFDDSQRTGLHPLYQGRKINARCVLTVDHRRNPRKDRALITVSNISTP